MCGSSLPSRRSAHPFGVLKAYPVLHVTPPILMIGMHWVSAILIHPPRCAIITSGRHLRDNHLVIRDKTVHFESRAFELGGSHRYKIDYIGDFRQSENRCMSLILNGRGERIRTSDPLVPNQVRYQTALRPDVCCSGGCRLVTTRSGESAAGAIWIDLD
jgi:hypothetical protein